MELSFYLRIVLWGLRKNMPISEDQRFNFFVYVVESPSAVDLYHRRSEGYIIQQSVNLNQIPCSVVTAINLEAFEAALKVGISKSMQAFPNMIPMLHISAHGYEEGIQLSSGGILSWAELRKLLIPLNDALNNNLVVCLSCCEGFSGTRMAMFLEDEGYPFYAIVANSSKPLWSDTAVAYSTFYHHVAKGEFLPDAVNAMKVASGNNTFLLGTAENSRQVFIEHISKLNASQVQEQLEKNKFGENPDNLEKMRKLNAFANVP
jgi:hypothetical protein